MNQGCKRSALIGDVRINSPLTGTYGHQMVTMRAAFAVGALVHTLAHRLFNSRTVSRELVLFKLTQQLPGTHRKSSARKQAERRRASPQAPDEQTAHQAD